MNLDEAIAAQIEGRLLNLSFILYIGSDDPVRAWGGVGRLALNPWGPDSEGGDYLGVGRVVNMPDLQQLVNGQAQRVEISLSGVTSEVVDLADSEAASIRYRDASIGMIFMDTNFQILAPPIAIWNGESDSIRSESSSDSEGTKTRIISVSLGSTTTGRRRPRFNLFTRAQQRARSATDAFCDRVSVYNQDRTQKWPY